MGQYYFARWHLLSVIVCNDADGCAGRPPSTWVVSCRGARLVGGWAADTAWRARWFNPVWVTPCFYYAFSL